MSEPMIFLRMFAEVGSAAEADAEMRLATARLERFGTVRVRRVEPYWKIPENWEVSLELFPREDPLAVYQRILALAESGWTIGEVESEDEDRWAVWNAEPGVEFLAPRIRWASVDLLPLGPNVADPSEVADEEEE